MAKSFTIEKRWETTAKRFVVFLDIMGFKDYVARHTHNEVYDMMTKISDIKDVVDAFVEKKSEDGKFINKGLYTTSFSDLVILFSKDDSLESFDLITEAASFIVANALENTIPMKGAISFGTISVNKDDQIYFGQPLIDAYLLQEEVQYYGIVAHNSIDEYISNMTNNEISENYVTLASFKEIKTPLKSGNIIHSNVNWFYYLDLGAFEESVIKKQFYTYIKKIKLLTSGSPRKYIDNTINVFELIYKEGHNSGVL